MYLVLYLLIAIIFAIAVSFKIHNDKDFVDEEQSKVIFAILIVSLFWFPIMIYGIIREVLK